jgi:hypothetical protein
MLHYFYVIIIFIINNRFDRQYQDPYLILLMVHSECLILLMDEYLDNI